MKPEKFTVLLLRPDYLVDNYGRLSNYDTYLAWVEANSAKHAVQVAQKEVFEIDNPDMVDVRHEEPEDYYPLVVFRGHLEALAIPEN